MSDTKKDSPTDPLFFSSPSNSAIGFPDFKNIPNVLSLTHPENDFSGNLDILKSNQAFLVQNLDHVVATNPYLSGDPLLSKNINAPFTDIFSELGNIAHAQPSMTLRIDQPAPFEFITQQAISTIGLEQNRILNSMQNLSLSPQSTIFANDLIDSSRAILDTTRHGLEQSIFAAGFLPSPATLFNPHAESSDEIAELKNELKEVQAQLRDLKKEEFQVKLHESTVMTLTLFKQSFPAEKVDPICLILSGAWQTLNSNNPSDDVIGQVSMSMSSLFEFLPDLLCDPLTITQSGLKIPKKKEQQTRIKIGYWLGVDLDSTCLSQDMRIRKQQDFYDKFSNIRHDPNRLGYDIPQLKALIFEAEGYLMQLIKKGLSARTPLR